MLTIYGIASCDKCRAAKRWFTARSIEYSFHDVRTDGLSESLVRDWLKRLGNETLINTRSKTWRDISPQLRVKLDETNACELILQYPTLIKRPLVDNGATALVGYDEEGWTQILA
jgi:Spx/MgsR family transcriptional regulator